MDNNALLSSARTYGTPLYVYDGDLIKEKYGTLSSAFTYRPLRILYAMKANYNPAILTLLKRQGAGIDAVSPSEVILAKRLGFTDILYTANNMTDHEMDVCLHEKVLFNIGSLSELKRYARAIDAKPHTERGAGRDICLRFNSGVEAGMHAHVMTGGPSAKFGILIKDATDALAIAKDHGLRVIGIHEHTGSGIPEDVKILEGFKSVLTFISRDSFPHLRFVDMGGGFKVPYRPEERQQDYAALGKEVASIMQGISQDLGRQAELCIEPGRFLVAESGILLVRAVTVKETAERTLVGTDAGFTQLIRPMLYGAYHHITNLTSKDAPNKYDITGNICETGDYFARERSIAGIKEGDILAVHTAGAYCYSMGSSYNLRPMPAEVLILDGASSLIRKRDDEQEFVTGILRESPAWDVQGHPRER